ncbi:hypothetical protein FOMPIDRAFT_43939 [Fomitopsis schrenkii]|uniref:Uncharacterized protein n=1 Tax=Fomitopsis schrenkii TaxID=2126942 RepID=S8EGV3_FOMSC|nr:hypothetical protein FOMPIDRAFT_43939 [Fomitopsis schrenkii]
MLYQSIYVYSLNHTDIRPIHHSLLDRKDCLGIYCVPGQMWCAVPSTDPVFLHFPDEETLNLWLALLRSYAVPEVYGRWLSPADGGLYRMWRQVELTCVQGRNLGTPRPLNPGGGGAASSDDPSSLVAGEPDGARGDADALDMDVYCEFFVDGCLCGRTTVKRGVGAPDWLERFVFSDLPPFEVLEVVVLREKRMSKPQVVGVVSIALMNFRRGEHIDGWFPVLSPNPGVNAQTGELRLKIRVDEEIILPFSEYSELLQTFTSKNSLDWLTDLESRLKLKNTIPHHIISIAIAKERLVDDIMELADREVDGTFRGNTVLTKTIELFMARYGGAFLEASVGGPIRRVCNDKIAIEVDPVRSGKGARSTEKNVEALVYWCQEFWSSIYEARHECPPEMRRLFEHIRRLVERRYGLHDEQNRDLPSQSVSAFCFLRFMVPAILHPHLFGLWPGLPDARVQRSLTLIAKVIQNLANLNSSVQKEDFMRGVKDFLTSSIPHMVDYIVIVSTPEPQSPSAPGSSPPFDKNDHQRIMHALRQRGQTAPVLYREATPVLPHVLDLPRHLAVVSALVVRYARARSYAPLTPLHSGVGDHFDEFCAKCLQVEERALLRVSQLASRPRRQPSQPSVSSPLAASIPLPPSPTSPMKIPGAWRERRISLPKSPRFPKKFGRPSTAPGTANSSPRTESESMPMSPMSDPERMLSHSALDDVDNIPPLERSTRPLRRPSVPFPKQLRSSSTDSALGRREDGQRLARASTRTQEASNDSTDDSTRKRKSILRGILRR